MRTRSIRLACIAALFVPALAQAQLIVGSGVAVTNGRDTRWTISAVGGAYSQGFVLPSRPGTANVPGSYQWIHATSDGNLNGSGTATFAAQTTFTLFAGQSLSVTMRCTADNTPLGVFINGVQAGSPSACGPANTYLLGAAQTFTNFIEGLNTIEVRYTGDRITDGVLIAIDNVTLTNGTPSTPGVVPEPSTYALMVSGLGLLGLVRRRTRTTV